MARTRIAYDNWQRLVEAVTRRQQILELFHAQSRSPSISSIESETSSSFSLQSNEKFDSRKHVEEEIMETLMYSDVNIIGISGTGGIGKTTMAKRIGDMMKKAKMFDEVIMTMVSRKPDIQRIQSDIAEALGLKLEDKALQVASRLSNVIKDSGNILVILDDVWDSLILKDVGIPSWGREKICKIMITSRSKDVLRIMQVEKVFRVQDLSDNEAWRLFKERVGSKAEDVDIQPFAKVLANKCEGLPLALNILGLALKGKDKRFWVDAVKEFKRRRAPLALPRLPKNVYTAVNLSCKWLSDEATSLFYDCCLFKEEGSDIHFEKLVRLGMMKDLMDGIMGLKEARSIVRELVGVLKDRSLLEDGRDPENVRMHDVVRDVCLHLQYGYDYNNAN